MKIGWPGTDGNLKQAVTVLALFGLAMLGSWSVRAIGDPSAGRFIPPQVKPVPVRTPEKQASVLLLMRAEPDLFFTTVERGARQAAHDMGVRLEVQRADTPEAQVAVIRSSGASALVVAPADIVKVIPAVREARRRGHPVVTIERKLDRTTLESSGMLDVPLVTVDNELGGYHVARLLLDEGGRGAYGILCPPGGHYSTMQRIIGARKGFSFEPSVRVLPPITVGEKSGQLKAAIGRLLATEDLRGIVCTTDGLALEALSTLEEAYPERRVLVTGFGATDLARKSVKSGRLLATVDPGGETQGYLGVRAAVEALNGVQVPLKQFVEPQLVMVR
jgi:ribose transport system substrate-binding protein